MPAHSSRLFGALLVGLMLGGLALLVGCGSDSTPVSAKNTKYRPVDGSTPPAAAGVPDAVIEPGAAPIDFSSDRPAGQAVPPTTPPADGADPLAVPAGDTTELIAFMNRLAKMRPRGRTQQEQVEDFVKIQQARLTAAKRILAANPEPAVKQEVVQSAFQMFMELARVGLPTVPAQLKEFATALTKDTDPEMVRLGQHTLFNVKITQLGTEQLESGEPIVTEIETLLANENENIAPDVLELASRAADVLLEQGLSDDASKAFTLIADAAKKSKDEKTVAAGKLFADRAKLVKANLNTLVGNVLAGEKDADTALVAAFEKLMKEVTPSVEVFQNGRQVVQFLEMTGHPAPALKCCDILETAFKEVEDKDLAEIVQKGTAHARQRLSLVGQPFTVEGVLLDGKPFDWASYKGKVVLVDFWATWCGPCLEEIPNVKRNYDEFKPLGFDVVGVNLDTEIGQVKKFFELESELPWTTITSQEVLDGKADPEDFGKLPMAAKCGVDSIPFLVLVGKDGKVDSLHVRGPKLRSRLLALLGEPSGDKPAAEEKPAAEKPAAKPADGKLGAIFGRSPAALMLSMALLAADPAATPDVADDPAINPYAAKPGLNSGELVQFILRMLDKPKTIQSRAGFTEAVSDACDRVLTADPPAKDADVFIAAESKFAVLHKKACDGDDAADKQLAAFVEKMAGDQRPRIARQVAFFQQERKVLNAVDGPVEAIPALLAELKDYFTKEKLEARHLRMASSTVALINKLADGDQRETHFAEFGAAFGKSSDKALASYGKKLAKKPEAAESDLVGKPLELVGTTAKGAGFAWESYRGKVVLVDFWATWCGPCRREMPNVKALHEKLNGRGFEVVGVSLDQDQEALAQYIEENALPWDTLAGDGTQELAQKYGVRAIPTMMLVGKDGKVLGVSHSLEALTPQIEKLVGPGK